MPAVTLVGTDSTERYLRSCADQIAYAVLSEVVDRNRNLAAARVSIDEISLAPWLDGPKDDDVDPDDEFEQEESNELDDGPTDHGADEASGALVNAAMRWLRETVGGLMTGRTLVKFKLGLWAPGGKNLLHSARFEARNTIERRREGLEQAPPEAVAGPMPSPLTPSVPMPPARPGPYPPEERAWQALGDGYMRLIGLTQSAYAHVASLQSASIAALAEQNGRLHGVVEELSDDLRGIHIGSAQAVREGARDAAGAQVRATLGKQFIDQLGAIGRTLAASQGGIPPELTDIVQAISGAPEIVALLKSPSVLAILRDESKRTELAFLLKMTIEQLLNAEGSTAPPGPLAGTSGESGAEHVG